MATSSAQTFQQQWRPGRRVQEVAPPHRRGSIRAVTGTGANATVVINPDGRPPVSLKPAQLTLT